MAVLAGRVVRVGQGAEVQQAMFLGALTGSDGNGAGHPAEEHRCAFVGHLVDVGDSLFRARGAVAADQLQRTAKHAAAGIDFVDGQQRAAHLGEALFLIAAGAGVVQAQFDGIGCLDRSAAAQHERQEGSPFHRGSSLLTCYGCWQLPLFTPTWNGRHYLGDASRRQCDCGSILIAFRLSPC